MCTIRKKSLHLYSELVDLSALYTEWQLNMQSMIFPRVLFACLCIVIDICKMIVGILYSSTLRKCLGDATEYPSLRDLEDISGKNI